MDAFSNSFEKKWTAVFLFFYFFIMIPFPWYFNETYQPSLWGVPSYVFGWLIHASIVFILIIVFAYQALKRPEYNNLPDNV